MRIYVASEAKYGPLWKLLRDNGANIISTWIDEWGPGQTSDWSDLWSRAVREASHADRVIVYRGSTQEVLKGALVEVGAALAHNITVLAVGCADLSFTHHPLVQKAGFSMDQKIHWPVPGTNGRAKILISKGLVEALILSGVDRETLALCSLDEGF